MSAYAYRRREASRLIATAKELAEYMMGRFDGEIVGMKWLSNQLFSIRRIGMQDNIATAAVHQGGLGSAILYQFALWRHPLEFF